MNTGFEHADTKTLEGIRDNLLGGLNLVAKTLDDGTFHLCREKGGASPAQFGKATLALLVGVVSVLALREVPNMAQLRDELAELGATR